MGLKYIETRANKSYTINMEARKSLTVIYTFFLGLILSIFIGFGINTFYEFKTDYSSEGETEELYLQDVETYNRNVSIVALVASILLLIIGLAFEEKLKNLADGFLLGGLFTLVYSMIRGIAANDSKYVFIIASIGLVAVLYLGYHRFLQRPKKAPKSKK